MWASERSNIHTKCHNTEAQHKAFNQTFGKIKMIGAVKWNFFFLGPSLALNPHTNA